MPMHDAIAVVAGAQLPLAFAPMAWWPFGLLAPALLYWACLSASPRRGAWRGALFGIASFGIGVSWIHESFQFSHIGLPIALVATGAFVVFLAVFPALACALFARVTQPSRRLEPLAAIGFAALYVTSEWLRGWFVTGFTWLQLGYAQVDGPLASALPIVGIYGVSLISVLLALTLMVALLGRDRWRWHVVVAVLLLAGATRVAGDRPWTVPDGKALRTAIVQGNVAQDQKWLPQMQAPTLERYYALTLRHLDADLVVWPETSVPGLRNEMRGFLDQVGRVAGESGVTVVAGMPERDPATGRTFNSVELLGASEGVYRKRHLVPFGEYLPLDAWLRPITVKLGIPVSSFVAGEPAQRPLAVGSSSIALFICYEIAFGAEVAAAMHNAGLIVTVSNDAWFGDSLGPLQHLQMARARALESGRYVVRATNTGLSAVIDPLGKVVLELPQFEVADGAAVIRTMRGQTPYLRAGDVPAMALTMALLALSFFRARRSS